MKYWNMNDYKQDQKIKAKLRLTWHPFFSRFGKFTDVQRECIPEILNKKNLIICSQTASGKTEAVMAPLIERHLQEKWNGLSILYISPTRALVNDLYERLLSPLEQLNVSLGRKTGDRCDFNKSAPSSVLITTPESTDSLLCRSKNIFKSLKAVVIDEIHLLDATPRGDQMRILLQRLRKIKREYSLNFYAISATLHDPAAMGERYFSDFKVVYVKGKRNIEYYLWKFDDNIIETIIYDFKVKKINKAIFFCNTRREVEMFGKKLKESYFVDKICIHHGSLSKSERENTEKIMKGNYSMFCVATMTLELGIDIGDVDAIVLVGPPHDLNSLLQRIGRGSRRKVGYTLSYGIYKNNWERIFFESLFNGAVCGEIGKENYAPCISVTVQQILSYICQKKSGISLESLSFILKPILNDEKQLYTIINYLSEKNFVKSIGQFYIPAEKTYNLFESGFIHSNIYVKNDEFQVVDVITNSIIGTIENPSSQFMLNGKIWQIVKQLNKKIYVKRIDFIELHSNVFLPKGSTHWNYLTGQTIKKTIFPDIAMNEIPYFTKSDTIYLFHFMGPLYGFIWQEILKEVGINDALDIQGTVLISKDKTIMSPENIEENIVMETITKKYSAIEQFLNKGSFYNLLPREMKIKSIALAVNVNNFINILKNMKYKEIRQEDYNEKLLSLINL